MKKRAMAKKAPARKSAGKAARPGKPAPAARQKPAREARTTAGTDGGKYTPSPIQGIGWAPFRYPL